MTDETQKIDALENAEDNLEKIFHLNGVYF
jgi:hypothetical protein